MPLHYVVGINCTLLKTKTQMSSIWAKGYVLMVVCGILHDMTTPPWWREKVIVYYYYYYNQVLHHLC